MIRWFLILGIIGSVHFLSAQDEGLETLPTWTEEDWERLQAGKIVPGSSLLGLAAQQELFGDLESQTTPESDLPEPEIEPEPEPEETFPTRIAAEFLPAYFQKKPSAFIVDPQKLLSMQEIRDRESFLDYHAKDSQISLIFYIFDAKQELPDGESAESLAQRFFGDDEKVAVVAYFMGMPEKTQIAYSREVKRLTEEKTRLNALRLAVDEALEKSDPTSQLESFSVQLSIKIYWMEREIAKASLLDESAKYSSSTEVVISPAERAALKNKQRLDFILKILLWTFSITVVFFLAWLGQRFSERKRKYYFPQVSEPPFLGSSHAAGGGGILHYRSQSEPPSSQKDEVPDYLGQL